MNFLIEKAHTILSKSQNSQHISFIIKRNTIICFGVNQKFKTTPLAHKFGYRFSAIHSELSCISNFPYPIKELKKYKIVNVRIRKLGDVGISKPCLICQRMLYSFGIREVYYTIGDGNGFRKLSL